MCVCVSLQVGEASCTSLVMLQAGTSCRVSLCLPVCLSACLSTQSCAVISQLHTWSAAPDCTAELAAAAALSLSRHSAGSSGVARMVGSVQGMLLMPPAKLMRLGLSFSLSLGKAGPSLSHRVWNRPQNSGCVHACMCGHIRGGEGQYSAVQQSGAVRQSGAIEDRAGGQ